MVAGLEEIPGILEDHNALLYGLHPTMLAIIHGEADAVAIREDGDILFGELRHFVGNGYFCFLLLAISC